MSSPRYIVKKELLFRQPNANGRLAIEIGNRGGRVDLDWLDRLVVTIPAQAAEHIAASKAVKYIQRVMSGNEANGRESGRRSRSCRRRRGDGR